MFFINICHSRQNLIYSRVELYYKKVRVNKLRLVYTNLIAKMTENCFKKENSLRIIPTVLETLRYVHYLSIRNSLYFV